MASVRQDRMRIESQLMSHNNLNKANEFDYFVWIFRLDSFQIKIKRRVSVFDNKINAVCFGRIWRMKRFLPRSLRGRSERRAVRESVEACRKTRQVYKLEWKSENPGKLLVYRRTEAQREGLLELRSFKFWRNPVSLVEGLTSEPRLLLVLCFAPCSFRVWILLGLSVLCVGRPRGTKLVSCAIGQASRAASHIKRGRN